jgi:hypothetical protein
MTDHVISNFQDDELTALEARAAALFGAEAVIAAVDRASAALMVSEAEPTRTLEQLLKFRDAIKVELRRLVTPQ